MRMGIGTEEQMRPAEDYVLKPFRKKDQPLVTEMMIRGADAVESILTKGLVKTMAEFNRIQTEELVE
jgi:peptidyl-tRNA hydrolase